jgi:hypothetical protein
MTGRTATGRRQSAPVMSMPTPAIASTAAGSIVSAGPDPAERTSTVSSARWRSHPAAFWNRPAWCTQANAVYGDPSVKSPWTGGLDWWDTRDLGRLVRTSGASTVSAN